MFFKICHTALNIFFDGLDFTLSEGGQNSISVVKTGSNADPITISVSFFTYNSFDTGIDSGAIPQPTSHLPIVRPDAAECKDQLAIVLYMHALQQ